MFHRKMKDTGQQGAVTIVEAAFVFPIMFIVIFTMIMVGEAYYQHARVEYEVNCAAVMTAARCENPMQEYIQNNGGALPTDPNASKVYPYRYILPGNAQAIVSQAKGELTQTINSMEPLAFRSMAPTAVSVKMTPKINILVSSLQVECEFDIQLPIRMIFSSTPFKFHYVVSTVESIGDPSEFVRNVSTVQDLLERNKEATEAFGEIKSGMEKLAKYIN